ncbi:MAG: gliding motility-associated C-terminal domain-containing protein [Chitinophagales bacterium]
MLFVTNSSYGQLDNYSPFSYYYSDLASMEVGNNDFYKPIHVCLGDTITFIHRGKKNIEGFIYPIDTAYMRQNYTVLDMPNDSSIRIVIDQIYNEYGDSIFVKALYDSTLINPSLRGYYLEARFYMETEYCDMPFSVSQQLLCEGDCVDFGDVAVPNSSFHFWQFEGGNPETYSGASPPPICYEQAGHYTVTLKTIHANGDSSIFAYPEMINVHKRAVRNADYPEDTIYKPYFISNETIDDYYDIRRPSDYTCCGLDIEYYPNSGQVSAIHGNCMGINKIYVEATHVYFLSHNNFDEIDTLINYGISYYTNLKCADTCYTVLYQAQLSDAFAPNTFTPNDNNRNDYFRILFSDYDKQDVDFLKVYNRWGELIFDSVEEGTVFWDGTRKGEACKQGLYLYYAQYTNRANPNLVGTIKGSVLLLR